MGKRQARLRRARRTRAKIRELLVPRLTVHRTGRHLYAQVISAEGAEVLAAANTLQPAVIDPKESGKNRVAAKAVGSAIGAAALAAGVEQVAFDRSGFKYHGRIKVLADAAREAGLKF